MKEILYIHENSVHNTRAADAFIPFLFKIFKPKSVLDVGCGTGTWLQVFYENGVNDIYGIDGNYVNASDLHINPDLFMGADLRKEIDLKRKFDLVVSLEVAEHLPERCSDIFVKTLTNHSDIILFSAALINQGGQNHINEQSFGYWVNKFENEGYVFVDAFRNDIWNNTNIDCWYRQNMFLVVKKNNDILRGVNVTKINDFYHPEIFNNIANSVVLKNNDIDMLKKQVDEVIMGKLGVIQSFKIFIKSILLIFK